MKTPKFEVFTTGLHKWFFRLKAANGEIICQSESYISKAMCLKGVRAVRIAALLARTEIL